VANLVSSMQNLDAQILMCRSGRCRLRRTLSPKLVGTLDECLRHRRLADRANGRKRRFHPQASLSFHVRDQCRLLYSRSRTTNHRRGWPIVDEWPALMGNVIVCCASKGPNRRSTTRPGGQRFYFGAKVEYPMGHFSSWPSSLELLVRQGVHSGDCRSGGPFVYYEASHALSLLTSEDCRTQ